MGTNSSKVLKRRYERGEFDTVNASKPRQLTKHKVVAIDVRNNRGSRRFECIVQELDTGQYTQTLTKVDDFLEKMNKTSPHISSFFFICGTVNKENCFDLVFEYGQNDVSPANLGDRVLKLLKTMLSGLKFLDEIRLFYPNLGWGSVLRVGNNFKLINQFCFPNFLHFVTNTLLNIQQNSYSLLRILRQKKAENFLSFQKMLRDILALNSNINSGPRFSNLGIFLKYMELQDPEKIEYGAVLSKMDELFDFSINGNKGYMGSRQASHAHFQIGSRPIQGISHSRSDINIRRNIITTPVRKKQSPFGHQKFPSSNVDAIGKKIISFSNNKREPIRVMKTSKTEKNISFMSRKPQYQNQVLQRVTSDRKLYIRDTNHNAVFGNKPALDNSALNLNNSPGSQKKPTDLGFGGGDKTSPNRKMSNLEEVPIVQKTKSNLTGGGSKLGPKFMKLASRPQIGSLHRTPSGSNTLLRKNSGLKNQIRRIGLSDRRNLKLNRSAHGLNLSSKLKMGLAKNKKAGLGSKLLRKNSNNAKVPKFGNIKRNLIATKNSTSLKKLRSLKFGQKMSHGKATPLRKLSSIKKHENKAAFVLSTENVNGVQHMGQIKPKKSEPQQETKELSQCGFKAKIGRDTNDTDQTKGKYSQENQIVEIGIVVTEVFDEEIEKAVETVNTSKLDKIRDDSQQWNIVDSGQKLGTLGGPMPDPQMGDLPPHLKDKYTLTLSEGPTIFVSQQVPEPTALAPPFSENKISHSQPPASNLDAKVLAKSLQESNQNIKNSLASQRLKQSVDINPFTRSSNKQYPTNLPDLGVNNLSLRTEKEKERNSNLTDPGKDVFINRRKTKYSKVIDQSLEKELLDDYNQQMEVLEEEEEVSRKNNLEETKEETKNEKNPGSLDVRELLESKDPRIGKGDLVGKIESPQHLSLQNNELGQQTIKVVRMKWDGKKYQQVTEYQSIRSSMGSRNYSRKNSGTGPVPKLVKSQSKTMQNLSEYGKIKQNPLNEPQAIIKTKSYQENTSNVNIRDSAGIRDSSGLRDSIPNKRTSIPFNAHRNDFQANPYQLSEPQKNTQTAKNKLLKIRLEDRQSLPRTAKRQIISPPNNQIGAKPKHSIDRRIEEENEKSLSPELKRRDSKFEELKKFVNTPKKLNPQMFFDQDKNGMINSASTKNILKTNKLDMKKSHSTYALPDASQSKGEKLDHAQAFANITPNLTVPKPQPRSKEPFSLAQTGRRETRFFEEANKNHLISFEDFGRCPENEYRMVIFRMEKRFKADKIFFNNPINFIEPEMRIQVKAYTAQCRNNTTGGLVANLKCKQTGALTTVLPTSVYHDMSQVVLEKKTLKPSMYHDLVALEDDFSFPEDAPKVPKKPVFHQISSGAKQIGENTFMVGGIEFKVMKSKSHSKSATNLHSLMGGKKSNVMVVSTHIPLGTQQENRTLGNSNRLRGGVQYKSSTNLHRTQAYTGSNANPRGDFNSNASFTSYSGQTQFRSHNPSSQPNTIGLSAEALRQRNKTRIDLHSGQRYTPGNYGLSRQGR